MTNFLEAKWENIVMVNYAVPASVLLPYLPYGVELDTYQGNAYVSLVGFLFKDTRIFKVPIPLLGTFEEVNLRFYVYRKEGKDIKRGVVFIKETVPYKAVAFLANKLYKEHYSALKTQSTFKITESTKEITYKWLVADKWNIIKAQAKSEAIEMQNSSLEEFIFEHYYGYTKVDERTTEEYKVNHPRWKVNPVINTEIECDFEANYGGNFTFLNNTLPASVFMAEGSPIEVKWKRIKI
ncbi:MAG: DUF2071 domain-containing protein [Chitinophagia bacterium]|nr:DUF2071 domain-containing protein [Chitinophagia bacterium]